MTFPSLRLVTSRRWRAACGAGAALGLGLPGLAHATDLGDAQLDVARSETAMSCPDAQQLGESIDRMGARPAGALPSEKLVLEVRIDRNDAGFSAEIKAFGRKSGVRRLSVPGESCDGLASALTVTLALLMDRQLGSESPKTQAPQAPTSEKPLGAPASRPSGAPATARPSLGFALDESLTHGLAYGWSAAVTADVAGYQGRWLVAAGGMWTPSRAVSFDAGRIEVQLLAGRARGCYAALGSWDKGYVAGCIEAAAGRLRGEGHGYPTTRVQSRPWVAGGGSIRTGGPIAKPFFWGVAATVVAPVQQQTFSVDRIGTGFESASIAWMLGAQTGVVLF